MNDDIFNTDTRIIPHRFLDKRPDFIEKDIMKICPDCGCTLRQIIPYPSIKCPRCGLPMEKTN